MSTMQKRRRFIELRGKGVSFRKIADEINVATSTVVRWSRIFAVQIKNAEKMEREVFEEKYLINRKHRVKVYATQLNNVVEELIRRDLSDVDTARLFEIQNMLRDEVKTQLPTLPFSRKTRFGGHEDCELIMDKTDTWEA